MSVTSEEIKSKLQSFGFGSGNKIMVHSSLSSFGRVEGGAETVIKALMELVGPEGTILMPSFNHGAPFLSPGAGIYDPKKTPCINGRIPDTFWRMEGVYRSLNPTHPFAAYGHDAERYTKNHHLTLTMGEDSPLGLIALEGGYQINIGTGHHTTTAKHVAETINRSPCLGYRTEAYPVRLPDDNSFIAQRNVVVMHRTWGWRERGCPLTDSGEYIEIEMEKQKLQKKGYISKSLVTYFKILDLLNVILDMLDSGYAGHPPCSECSIRPGITSATCASDWEEKGDVRALKAQIKGK